MCARHRPGPVRPRPRTGPRAPRRDGPRCQVDGLQHAVDGPPHGRPVPALEPRGEVEVPGALAQAGVGLPLAVGRPLIGQARWRPPWWDERPAEGHPSAPPPIGQRAAGAKETSRRPDAARPGSPPRPGGRRPHRPCPRAAARHWCATSGWAAAWLGPCGGGTRSGGHAPGCTPRTSDGSARGGPFVRRSAPSPRSRPCGPCCRTCSRRPRWRERPPRRVRVVPMAPSTSPTRW